MKNIYLLLVIACLNVFATCKKGTMEEANKAFEKKEFAEAAQIYASVARGTKNTNERKEAYFKEGLSEMMFNDYSKAQKSFEKAIRYKYGAEAEKKLAQILMLQENYTEAIIKLDAYLKDNPDDEEAKRLKEGSTLALKWKDEKTRYIIENFKKVNTRESDYAPYFLDKEGLVFTSDRPGGESGKGYSWTGNYFSDVYIAKLKRKRGEVAFDNPTLLEGEVNTKFNDGVASFSDKGRTIYFTQCNDANGKGWRCKVYSASKRGREGYNEPALLEFSASDSFSCGHPTVSPDGKQLFFSSNMPGGYGGWDLYVVNFVRRGRTWSEPINLGPTINTEKDEMYPYVHKDGELYFSSNGHVGIGGLDLYHTIGTGQEWTKPVNMKSPLNSGGDDFALWLAEDAESGYFTSNREGGRGQDDIYSFTMKPCELFITGVVRDEETKKVIPNAIVRINSNKDTSTIVLKTDASGSYKLPLTKDTKYEMYAGAPANDPYYFDSPKEFNSSEGKPCFTTIVQDFELKKLHVTTTVEGILYDLDKANIRPDAARILEDSVISVLIKFPRIKIELGSHTDCRASHEYNEELSQRRADSAVAFIISRGIDSDRVVAKGYGETDLRIKKCQCDLSDTRNICTEEEHQLNRRTTVKIIDYNYIPIKQREGYVAPKPEEAPAPQNENDRRPPPRQPQR